MEDPYLVLKVDREADDVVIRRAYRDLARRQHPDFGGDTAQMAVLNEAWRILGNPRRRAAYDAEFRRRQPHVAVVAAAPGAASPGRWNASGGPRPDGPASPTTLDFGRYAGWSLDTLAVEDPDYLEWLARVPIGRHFAAEIGAVLAQRRGAPTPQPPMRGKRRWRR